MKEEQSEIKSFDRAKFEEEIQKTLDKFELPPQIRRQIFSQVQHVIVYMWDHAHEQRQRYLKAQKSTEKAILNDKTSELTETSE